MKIFAHYAFRSVHHLCLLSIITVLSEIPTLLKWMPFMFKRLTANVFDWIPAATATDQLVFAVLPDNDHQLW